MAHRVLKSVDNLKAPPLDRMLRILINFVGNRHKFLILDPNPARN